MIIIVKDFFLSKTLNEIHSLGSKKNGAHYMRESVFFRLLAFDSDGVCFNSFRHFSDVSGCPIKQCELIWDYCVRNKILVKESDEFHAHDWMVANGFIQSQNNPSNLRPSARKRQQAIVPMSDAKTCAKTQNNAQETDPVVRQLTPSPAQRGQNEPQRPALVKEAVRHNVWLDRDEIATLLKTLTQDELTKCLDLLSDWKGKNHVSGDINDFKQINKWVIGSVRQKKSASRNSTDIDPDDFQEFLDEYVKG